MGMFYPSFDGTLNGIIFACDDEPPKLIAGPNENHPFLEDFVALQGRHVRGIDPDRSCCIWTKICISIPKPDNCWAMAGHD